MSTARVFFYGALVFLWSSLLYGSPPYIRADTHEVNPPALQAEAMRSDFLRGRPLYDQQSRELWLSGRKSLWRWNLLSSAVTRFDLPTQVHQDFRLLALYDRTVAGFDKRYVWLLDVQTKSWRKISGEFKSDCPVSASAPAEFGASDGLVFVSRCGVYRVDLKASQFGLQAFKKSLKGKLLPSATIINKPHVSVLFLQPGNLLRYSLQHPKGGPLNVYSSKSDLRGVTYSSSAIYAWTAKAIIVFDANMRRRKVIPVVGPRKISAFTATQKFHLMTFDDGTFELIALHSKGKWYGDLSSKKAQHVDFIDDDGYLLVSGDQKEPRVFRVTISD
jgi:hypothetical protein